MAGNDELKYIVRFQPHEGDLDEISERLRDLKEQFEDLGTEEAQEATKDYTEAMNEMNESNAEGIERLIELQEQIDGYKASLKEIKESKKESLDVGDETLRQEQEESAALKIAQQDYRNKQKSVMANKQAMEGSSATMGQMKARLRELKVAMDNVPLDDQTGELESLQTQWKTVNDTLKANEKAMGDHRRNVGAYSEAISTAASSVAVFHGPLGPVAGRLTALNSTIGRAIPMIRAKAQAWGILRLAVASFMTLGIVAVIAGITAALSRSQAVADRFSGVIRTLGASVDHVVDRIGYWIGANEDNNLTLRESIALSRDLHTASIELEEAEIDAITTKAELQKQVALLRREAEDEIFTHEERIDKMQEAMNAERELYDTRRRLKEREVHLMGIEIEMTESSREEIEKYEEAKASLIKLEEQHETAMRQLTRRRQSVINSLYVEEQRRRTLIRTMNQQREEAMKESADIAIRAQRDTQDKMERWLIDRQLDMLRAMGRDREVLELRTQQAILGVRSDYADKRLEVERNSREAIEAEMELLQKNNVDEKDAELNAIATINERHAEEEIRLRQELSEHRREYAKAEQENDLFTKQAYWLKIQKSEEELANVRINEEQEIYEEKRKLMADNITDKQAHERAFTALEEQFKENRIALAQAEMRAKRATREMMEQEAMQSEYEQQERRIEAEQTAMQEITTLQMEQTQLELAIQQGRNEEIVKLEQQRSSRVGELRTEHVKAGMDEELALTLAHLQADLEYKEQFADAEKALAQEVSQYQQDMINETAHFATATLEAMFYDMKEARIAQAIINTAAAVTEALASGVPPLSTMRALSAAAAGAAQIRQIMATNIGDRFRPQVSGMERTRSDTGFTVTGSALSDRDTHTNRRSSAGFSMATRGDDTDSSPVFVFEGDLDEEVMAIKVRRGSERMKGKSINVVSNED